MSDQRFAHSIKALSHALKFEKDALNDEFYYGGIAKAFEVALEYAWKFFKRKVEESGLECPSPRDSIKLAGKIEIISDVEKWLYFLKIRNIAVHDYLGISKKDYLSTIKDFLAEARKLNLN